MDKKNTFIGVLLVAAAIAAFIYGQRNAPRQAPSVVRQANAVQAAAVQAASPLPSPAGEFAIVANDHGEAKTVTLENGFVQVHFTDFGGAIRDVGERKYPRAPSGLEQSGPFVFNALHADPILALVDFAGLDKNTRFDLVSQTPTEVVFRAVLAGRLEVTRRYAIAPDQVGATDPYQLRAETTFRNLSAQATTPMRVALAVGTAAPISPLDNGLQIGVGYVNDGSSSFIRRSQLEASNGFLGFGVSEAKPAIETAGPVTWAAVKNQFFTSLLTPDHPAAALTTRRVKLLPLLGDEVRNAYGIAAMAQFDVPALAPQGQATLGASLYVGPTEYHRLANTDVFKADQDKIMQFGKYLGIFSALLLTLMTKIHVFVPNWGLAIICTTLTLRLAMMIFTIPAARSARRMQKIQPELAAIKAKYKDNPQKQQSATMELFKEHKVNPVGGCLPMLFTMPFFFGFFRMLQGAAELRYAPFLWAHDISSPDTIGFIFGFPINIMPLILGAVTFAQMQLVPQPSVDNAQARMMKFTPLIFMAFCYSYPAALSLYSTTNGLFMIGQQMLINRMKDDGDPLHAKPASGKSLKNVTPAKKKK